MLIPDKNNNHRWSISFCSFLSLFTRIKILIHLPFFLYHFLFSYLSTQLTAL